MDAVRFEDVTKTFHRHSGRMLLRSRVKQVFTHRGPRESFYALKGVSFSLPQGESLGVIGSNGAGKSTLLCLMAGLARPDAGSVAVKGRVAALFELGTGFHPDLTGAENVRLNASLVGLTRKQTNDLFGQIVEFSGIGDFIGEPLRTYSSGMVMRLAFSVAINVDPEVLLIDEVLAVGDAAFQQKCFDRIRKFRAVGKTLVVVSHSAAMVQEMCHKAIWLDHGELVMEGTAAEVLAAYSGARAVASGL